MAVRSSLGVVLFLLSSAVAGQEVSITPFPTNECVPGEVVTFECIHTGDTTQWFFNDVEVTSNFSNPNITVNGSILSFRCEESLNLTRVQCQSMNTSSNVSTLIVNRTLISNPAERIRMTGIIIGLVSSGIIIIVFGAIAIVSIVCCVRKRLKEKPGSVESSDQDDFRKRNEQRTAEQEAEQARAKEVVQQYLEGDEIYDFKEQLKDLGSRLEKYWFKVEIKLGKQRILTIAPLPKRCALQLKPRTLRTLNRLCTKIVKKEHPYVHSVHRIDYIRDTGHVIVIQDKYSCGSLRDELHQYGGPPEDGWYGYKSKDMRPLAICGVDEPVSYFGRQILQGLKFFYDQGFPPLGHVHSGNIYIHVEEEEEGRKVCKVGGYVNTLLGYKAQLHNSEVNMDMIDIVMFGHVIYEMAEGKSLSSAIPDEDEYKDSSVEDVLQFIFGLVLVKGKKHISHNEALNKIMKHTFFKSNVQEKLPSLSWGILNDWRGEVSGLLDKVTWGEPAKQQEPVTGGASAETSPSGIEQNSVPPPQVAVNIDDIEL